MTPNEPDLSLVNVAVLALSFLIGPQLAAVVGAYAVIMLGWVVGVMVGVYRMPTKVTRGQVIAFSVVTLGAVLGVTVPLAELAAQAMRTMAPWMTPTEAKGLLFPVAFALPAIGHSWGDVAEWAWGLIRRRFGSKEGQQP